MAQPGYYGGYPPPRRTNTLAILSLVMAFVIPPAGIVLGIMARKQIKQTREDGLALATAGLVCSVAFTVLYVLAIVLWIVAFTVIVRELPNVTVPPTR